MLMSRRRYSLQARIVESDGGLALAKETAYKVTTEGNQQVILTDCICCW